MPLLQAIPPGLIVLVVVFAATAAWVLADARARFSSGSEGWVWAAGTLVALPIFLPLYLIGARPVGRTTVCPACGRGTLSHRAACLHCGYPITFEAFPDTWGLGEVIGVATVFMVSLPVIAGAVGVQEPPTPVELAVFSLAQNVLLVGLAAYVTGVRYHQPLATIGIRAARWPWLIAIGVLVGSVTIPLSAASERLAVLLIGIAVGPHRAEAMASAEHANNVFARVLQTQQLGTGELVSILVLVGVLAPIGEEVFFRGFVYSTLRRWGVPLAVALSAAYFGAVHQQIVHFLPITILGVVLALLYHRTGSLVPSVAVHGVNNIVAILALVYGWNI
jgi:membrane protease YdiL (CAAX protease family)